MTSPFLTAAQAAEYLHFRSSAGIRNLVMRGELLRAQFGDFADGYDLSPATTQADKVRLIGNSVAPAVARALVAVNVGAGAIEAVA